MDKTFTVHIDNAPPAVARPIMLAAGLELVQADEYSTCGEITTDRASLLQIMANIKRALGG